MTRYVGSLKDTKTVTTRKGEKKVLTVDGSMESEKHRVRDSIDEINYDRQRRGQKPLSSTQCVGNSKAVKFIRTATSFTKWGQGQYERIFKKRGQYGF